MEIKVPFRVMAEADVIPAEAKEADAKTDEEEV